ncbi:YybH family protein [Maricaulis sp. CAU 1757]
MARSPKASYQAVGDKAAVRAIAAAREVFNEALERRSLKTIAGTLCDSALLVPGDEAEPIIGRDRQVEAWSSIFSAMPDVRYVRSPQRIEVGEDGYLAAETGRWHGAWSSDGLNVQYSGRYTAKWRLDLDGEWRIEAEIFVTLRRSGSSD